MIKLNYLALFSALLLLGAVSIHAKKHHTTVSNETHVSDNDLIPNLCSAINKPVTVKQYQNNLEDLASCKYDRDKLGDIFLKYFDPEGIQMLSITGCQLIINTYVPKALRSLVDHLTEGGCSGIMDHCDCDGDGFIVPGIMLTEMHLPNGRKEMDSNRPYCLNTCKKLVTLADVLSHLAPPEAITAALNPNYTD